ncbi:amidohydrolase [Saccharibacillus sp. CPCC 101409]|uniref:amidohydrolase n=1 Tax=Saccharibacillus sp. CPCC 101409 TaxID=3058041 RepID=UPI0026714169|nr:amidohydrolase [Saccharibacillus sp. CPCC 101409]MDO3411392.1 amidohydrolase [Saccharibacillus sp. CPCC 101409]
MTQQTNPDSPEAQSGKEEAGLVIEGALILTMEEEQRTENGPFTGDIRIAGSRIDAVRAGDAGQTGLRRPGDEVIDGRGRVAMPGLINAHQHTPMSLLRGFSDDLKLMDWLERKMFPAEDRMTPDDIEAGARLAIAEMIRSGTTAFADMYIHMDRIAEAVSETGMRASLTRGLITAADDGGRRMREALELIDRCQGAADGRITTMLGPHSPFLCSPEALQEIAALAESRRIPVHIHLAETVEEVFLIRERHGRTPAEHLRELGIIGPRVHTLLAHAVHLTQGDIELLRGMRGGVSHNPVSNMKLGCGAAPVPDMLRAGITVGLGTDGAGSATTLDMFQEVRAAAWMHRLTAGDPTAFCAYRALRMATAGSAELLGLGGEIGTLTPGKKADVILIGLDRPHLQPVHDVYSLLAYAANGSDVETVVVDGRVLMRDRELTTLDEERVLREAAGIAARITAGI